MAFKLNRNEINLLNELYGRWQKRVEQSNYNLLLQLYGSGQKVKERYKTFKRIDVQLLAEDFIGAQKKFKTLWDLIRYIRKVLYLNIREVRLLLPQGTILAIYGQGTVKSLVLAVKRPDKKWVYKIFTTMHSFMEEMAARESLFDVQQIPYARITLKMAARKNIHGELLPAFSKEDYEGTDLHALSEMARTDDEKRLMQNITGRIRGKPQNFAYNWVKKEIHAIDYR